MPLCLPIHTSSRDFSVKLRAGEVAELLYLTLSIHSYIHTVTDFIQNERILMYKVSSSYCSDATDKSPASQ